MRVHHYPTEYAGRVRDESARDFLVTVGLPAKHVLFTAAEGDVRTTYDAVKIGYGAAGGGEDAYVVDAETGAVGFVDLAVATEMHVNASPRQFAEFLAIFEWEVAEGAGDDQEEVAAALEEAFTAVDPTALSGDPGFWRSILDDVSVGDYRDED